MSNRMMLLDVPEAPELLEELGKVSIRHAHLDRMLQMTIKSLSGVDVNTALDATERDGSAYLRKQIRKLARARLGEGEALLRLLALLKRCGDVSQERNDLLHGVWAKELDGEHKMQTSSQAWKALPTVAELRALGDRLQSLVLELNNARLHGYLAEALKAKK